MLTLTNPVFSAPPVRWTRAEVRRMEEIGLLDGRKYELVEGVLVSTMGKGRAHSNALIRLLAVLRDTFGADRVNHEMPVDVDPADIFASEPEPDAVVLTRSTFEIVDRNPQPDELALVVEISQSTLAFDLGPKARLYARAGIPEYWVLDLAARQLLVHREPQQGLYASIQTFDSEGTIEPLSASGAAIRISQLLP
jgi:Uma2 family endonuclease